MNPARATAFEGWTGMKITKTRRGKRGGKGRNGAPTTTGPDLKGPAGTSKTPPQQDASDVLQPGPSGSRKILFKALRKKNSPK